MDEKKEAGIKLYITNLMKNSQGIKIIEKFNPKNMAYTIGVVSEKFNENNIYKKPYTKPKINN